MPHFFRRIPSYGQEYSDNQHHIGSKTHTLTVRQFRKLGSDNTGQWSSNILRWFRGFFSPTQPNLQGACVSPQIDKIIGFVQVIPDLHLMTKVVGYLSNAFLNIPSTVFVGQFPRLSQITFGIRSVNGASLTEVGIF